MKFSLSIVLILLLVLITSSKAATFAVLVAGSKEYAHYRYQADICHAYQTLIRQGVPSTNIFTLSFDDAPRDMRNPYQNELYSVPGPESEEVYRSCPIDYRERNNNLAVFEGVMMGDKSAVRNKGSGRVLDGITDQDNLFLYFSLPGSFKFI